MSRGRFLAFDTSTEVLSIGLAHEDQTLVRTLPGGAQASASLIPAAMSLLEDAGMPLTSLDAIVFGCGPGSFTGLRTACAVAQGLALGAQLPVVPVNTLLAVAQEARLLLPDLSRPLTVLALLDARMDEVYSAIHDWDGRHWSLRRPLQVGSPQHVALPDGAHVWMAGNAFEAYGDRLPAGRRLPAQPTARALLQLAPGLMAAGGALGPEQAMPLYIRDKVALTTAEREAASNRGGA
jgi:tRNA threonylcarbamoyladenosine biosynthesis protein TsaB